MNALRQFGAVLALFIAVFLGSAAPAFAAVSIITDDNFTRANTTVGGAANSTNVTGPATFNSPSTGGNYVDITGTYWTITSNALTSTALAGNSYSNSFLLRPTSEDAINVQAALTANLNTANGGAPCVLVRANRTSGKAYAAFLYWNGSNWVTGIAMMGPGLGVLTSIASSTLTATQVPNGSIILITLTATGTSPTSLTATFALASTPGTIIQTLTGSDSTSDLQQAGSMGISGSSSVAGAYPQLTHLTTSQITAGLAIGNLNLAPSQSGITLSLTAALSSGTGSGYSYAIYRGTDPNFTANSGSLLTTQTSMPYTDTTAVAGTQYFYGVVGSDSSAATVYSTPANLTNASTSVLYYASAQINTTALNMVFVGDSITYGLGVSNAGTMSSPTAPYFAVTKLQRLLGIRNIYGANKGVSGYTTTDWAPGGSTYNGAIEASNTSSSAYVLNAANPTAKMVFNIMLGVNDSASAGTNNGGVAGLSASQFSVKMKAIVDQILTVDWPSAIVIIHDPSYYTPNFQNGSTYLQDGLSRLYSYRAAMASLVASYATSNPGQVFLGDTYAFNYFAENFAAEMQNESGVNGFYHVHPAGTAGTNGFIGTQTLGELWAEADAQALYGVVGAAPARPTFRPGFH